MSMISERVKQIRDVADSYREMRCDICTQKVLYEAADTIEALSAKVREQNLPVHGEWILADEQRKEDTDNDNYRYICSECGHSDLHSKSQEVPYCWWCGAKMKGGEK